MISLRRLFLFLFLLLLYECVQAQELTVVKDTQNIVFDLGEVIVVGSRTHPFTLNLGPEELIRSHKKDVTQALVMLSGISIVKLAQKNDAMVNVRGFDLRQIPVYVDGVPVYVSYDGYADLGRFLVSGLSKISVTRGETSLLVGPNALGGAINLVSRKPVLPFELEGSAGVILHRGGYGGLQTEMNVGGRKEKYYFQGSLAFSENKPFALSNKFDLGSGSNGLLLNSQQQDINSSIKAGFTPNQTDSYVLSCHFQNGSKGVPEYRGADLNQRIRYWQFPAIRKQGVHFNSKTSFGKQNHIQTRFFYDDYFSDLRSFDDSTITSQERRSSFISIYDDETLGGSINLAIRSLQKHEIKTAIHTVYDHHREHNIHPNDEPVRHFRDLTYSFGLEDQFRITERFTSQLGVGFHLKENLQADNYNPGTDSIFSFSGHHDKAFNVLIGFYYEMKKYHRLSTNLSRKNRFPTMKDRYSYRLGMSIPNADLVSETSWNLDISYAFIPGTAFQFKTAVFFSRLRNAIQAVYGVDPENSAIYQYQNTGDAQFYGWEAEFKWDPLSAMQTRLQYTYTERQNLSNKDLIFTDVPRHKLYTYITYNPLSRLSLHLSGMYNSPRISTSNGLYSTDPFVSLDFRTSFTILSSLSLNASIANLLDANYSFVEGYPVPGRQFYLGIAVKIK